MSDKPVKWRMKQIAGEHVFRDARGKVKAGDTFTATPYEVRHIRHKLESLEEFDEPGAVPKTPPAFPDVPRFTIKHKGRGMFAVLDATGVQVNDVLLSKEEALIIAGIPDDSSEV